MAAVATVTTSVHTAGGVTVVAVRVHDGSPHIDRAWVSLASAQPSFQLHGTNFARTCRRLLKLDAGSLEGSGHYLTGSEANSILAAAASAPDAPAGLIVEGDRLVSPHLLSRLLLTWSMLPKDHPGNTRWRSSGARPFTTMEEFDAMAARIEAHEARMVR